MGPACGGSLHVLIEAISRDTHDNPQGRVHGICPMPESCKPLHPVRSHRSRPPALPSGVWEIHCDYVPVDMEALGLCLG
jgi:hypothetical protein